MSEEIRKSIGERLKLERERCVWSQATFAEHSDVSKRAVAAWEAGESTPGADALTLLSREGVDVLFILTGARTTPAESSLSIDEAALLNAYRRIDSQTPVSARQVVGQFVAALAHPAAVSSPVHKFEAPRAGPRIAIAGSVGQHVEGNAIINAPQTIQVGTSKKQK